MLVVLVALCVDVERSLLGDVCVADFACVVVVAVLVVRERAWLEWLVDVFALA